MIYSRYETGGMSGGNCWREGEARPFSCEPPKEQMKVLDIILEKLCPKLTYLQYKKLQELVHDSEKTEWEYYGNCKDWKIQYILVSDFEKFLEQL